VKFSCRRSILLTSIGPATRADQLPSEVRVGNMLPLAKRIERIRKIAADSTNSNRMVNCPLNYSQVCGIRGLFALAAPDVTHTSNRTRAVLRHPAFCFLLLLWVLVLAACAKINDPVPPEVLVPKPATDLTARQYAGRILLAVSVPASNTDGSRALTLGQVEVFRLAGDRLAQAPLPQEEFLGQAVRIFAVPAAKLGSYLDNGRFIFSDTAAEDPAAFYAQGYRYAVRFINRKNQTAGLSNQAFVAPVAIPGAPEGLGASTMRDRIRITWNAPTKNVDGSMPPRIAGYNVYRSEVPLVFPPVPIHAAPLLKPEFDDLNFQFDQAYYYAVTVVGSRENPYAESLPSSVLAFTPRDTFPPGAPVNLDKVVQNGIVTLLWGAPEDSDLAGYRVYRRDEGATERVPLLAEPAMVLSFRDDKALPGKTYEYMVVAVDKHGNAGPAAAVSVEVR
jgi:hypothetical protein